MSDVINELMLTTRVTKRVTSIIVTHDMRTAQKVADRVVMLYPFSRLTGGENQVIFDGTPAELDRVKDKRVRQFVLGEAGERLMEMRRQVTDHPMDSENLADILARDRRNIGHDSY
jgi:phospholipid/cholesterol/gamma-HCH transport system ATP-binding protein